MEMWIMLFVKNCLPFKFLFQQLHWFLQLWSCFMKWYEKERSIRLRPLRIHNGSCFQTLNLLHVSSCKMFTFCDVSQFKLRVWVFEWVVTSRQELPNLTSSGNCFFSSWWNKLRSSEKNKGITLLDVPEVTSFSTNLPLCGQLHWAWLKREI